MQLSKAAIKRQQRSFRKTQRLKKKYGVRTAKEAKALEKLQSREPKPTGRLPDNSALMDFTALHLEVKALRERIAAADVREVEMLRRFYEVTCRLARQ